MQGVSNWLYTGSSGVRQTDLYKAAPNTHNNFTCNRQKKNIFQLVKLTLQPASALNEPVKPSMDQK